MKKFFGWFFIVTGIWNIIRAVLLASDGVHYSGSQSFGAVFTFGVGFIGLGIWMISSTKKSDN